MLFCALFVCLAHLQLVAGAGAGYGEGWNYYTQGAHAKGPSTWKNVPGAQYCGHQSQSPINIHSSDAKVDKSLGVFELRDYDQTANVSFNMKNRDTDIEFKAQADSGRPEDIPQSVYWNNTLYRLYQFHFHWGLKSHQGSEHQLDSQQYAGEMHIIHYNTKYGSVGEAIDKKDGLLVWGHFLQVTSEDEIANPHFERMMSDFQRVEKSGNNTNVKLNLKQLLPEKYDAFFHYSGGLTTPPCYESVSWFVNPNPIKISEKMMREEFRNLEDGPMSKIMNESIPMGNNYRPIQPLNNRTVKANFDPHMECSDKNVVGKEAKMIKFVGASQSSTEDKFACENNTCTAKMAMDGDVTNSGAVTKYTSFSWWAAEMETVAYVEKVVVYANSWAVQQGYFRRFKVETKVNEGDEWKVCKKEHEVQKHDPHVVQCDDVTVAKYVRVSVSPMGSCAPLYLHEVEVMGTPTTARPGGPKMMKFPAINEMKSEDMMKLENTDADAYVKTIAFSQVKGKEMQAGVMLVNPGPALEFTHSYETMMMVLSGSFNMTNGTTSQHFTATTGQSMYIPRGAQISYQSMDNQPARMYFVMQPPTMEKAFALQDMMKKNPMVELKPSAQSLYPNISYYKNDFNSSSWLDDFLVSNVSGSGMTAGLYKLLDGPALKYTYEYEEFKYIVSGQFDLTDGTGQQVTAKAGDLMYFPKNTFVHFTAPQSALGFFVGQRAEGTA